jgi:hypothetical protein
MTAFLAGAVTTAAAWFSWWLWYRPRLVQRVATETAQLTFDAVRLALYASTSAPMPGPDLGGLKQ